MRKGNVEYIAVYAAVIAAVILTSFLDIGIFEDADFIRIFRKFTFTAPVLFIIAAFLSFRIAETRIALISLVMFVLSFSDPLLNFLTDRVTETLSVPGGMAAASHRIQLMLCFALSLVFILPERIRNKQTSLIKIIIVLMPFVLAFIPGEPGLLIAEKVSMENRFLVPAIIFAALLPAGLVFIYKSRRTVIFSAAYSAVLVLSVLPLLMQLIPFLSDICRLFSGVILLHVLYRVYWENSYLDELTGIFNRRAFDERMRKLRKGYALSMVDVDHFKNFNDTYGHDEGDNVLRLVSSILYKHFRKNVYRYGGEEFCVVFGRKKADFAVERMDAARSEIAGHGFSIRSQVKNRKKSGRKKSKKRVRKVKLTVSAGISMPSESVRNPVDVLKNADKALYKAKDNGRNRVEVAKRR